MLGLVTSDGGRRFFSVPSLRIEMSNFNQRGHQFYIFVITIWIPLHSCLMSHELQQEVSFFRT